MMNRFASAAAALLLAAFAAQSLAADKPMLADRHVARGLKCEMCHTSQPPKAVPMTQCLKCHVSYEALAKKTDKLDINPHASHVENIACSQCHHGHKKPSLVCDECHEFRQLKVP